MGISIIDEEHKKSIDIVNKIIVAKRHNNNPGKIEKILNEMIDYASDYFKGEEAHMLETTYPDYKQHKEEHLIVVLKTLSYFNNVASGDYRISLVPPPPPFL